MLSRPEIPSCDIPDSHLFLRCTGTHVTFEVLRLWPDFGKSFNPLPWALLPICQRDPLNYVVQFLKNFKSVHDSWVHQLSTSAVCISRLLLSSYFFLLKNKRGCLLPSTWIFQAEDYGCLLHRNYTLGCDFILISGRECLAYKVNIKLFLFFPPK